jgi:hypothetical protein
MDLDLIRRLTFLPIQLYACAPAWLTDGSFEAVVEDIKREVGKREAAAVQSRNVSHTNGAATTSGSEGGFWGPEAMPGVERAETHQEACDNGNDADDGEYDDGNSDPLSGTASGGIEHMSQPAPNTGRTQLTAPRAEALYGQALGLDQLAMPVADSYTGYGQSSIGQTTGECMPMPAPISIKAQLTVTGTEALPPQLRGPDQRAMPATNSSVAFDGSSSLPADGCECLAPGSRPCAAPNKCLRVVNKGRYLREPRCDKCIVSEHLAAFFLRRTEARDWSTLTLTGGEM